VTGRRQRADAECLRRGHLLAATVGLLVFVNGFNGESWLRFSARVEGAPRGADEGRADPEAHDHEDHDHEHPHDHSAHTELAGVEHDPPASDVALEMVETVFENQVEPVIASFEQSFALGNGLASATNALRVLLNDVRETVAQALSDRPEERRSVLFGVRRRLESRLSELAQNEAAREGNQAAVNDAVEGELVQHREQLYTTIVCWCPKENWTRSLKGCPDGCANEQKSMIVNWLRSGLTNDEIIARLIAHPKGGEQVRGTGKGAAGYLFPFLMLAFGSLMVGAALLRVRKPHASAKAQESGADDACWDDEIEEQLREMDA